MAEAAATEVAEAEAAAVEAVCSKSVEEDQVANLLWEKGCNSVLIQLPMLQSNRSLKGVRG